MLVYVLLGILIGLEVAHFFERRKLLNRIMAKNYGEYQYFEKQHKDDVKDLKKLRERATKDMEEIDIEDEIAENTSEKQRTFMEGLESDWSDEEIDKSKIKEM